MAIPLIFSLLLLSTPLSLSSSSAPHSNFPTVCIIGSGIAGSSVSHFLRQYSYHGKIHIFERNGIVGGRMATVSVAGDTFEAGASILHPKNYHALNFTKLLNLKVKEPSSANSFSLGIWNGHKFIFKTLNSKSKFPLVQQIVSITNSVLMFVRYGFSLLRMSNFVEVTVDSFLKYYGSFESRPIFHTVEEMLKWAGLYNLTTRTLQEELVDAGLSSSLIEELATESGVSRRGANSRTEVSRCSAKSPVAAPSRHNAIAPQRKVQVITRINYGQSVNISGLAGAVSLAGSGGGLWAIEGGNWQMAAGLINRSDVALHINEEIKSISYLGSFYELNSSKGNSYKCEVTVVATPLDEVPISFSPAISIPERKLQHTHATFVRGLLNPAYFGFDDVSDIPELVGTTETPDLQFTSISVLKEHNKKDMTYKIFSRQPMTDVLLDQIFSARTETIRINWGAYPHYHAPEKFAPFVLDSQHLYYINTFENAASSMETSAVAAENIARLILSRFSGEAHSILSGFKSSNFVTYAHSDL